MQVATFIIAAIAFAMSAGLWFDKWWQRRQVKKTLVEAMRTAIAQRAEMQRQEASIVYSAPSWRTYPKGTN
jgi:hypothetical protein